MLKKYVEIKFNGKIVGIAQIKECEPVRFIELEKEAKANLGALTFAFNQQIEGLKREVADLKKEIKFLKGED